MGGNTHIERAASIGYKSEATITVIVKNIDPLSGYRIAIRAFQATCSVQAAKLYFNSAAGETTVDVAAASGAAYVHLAGNPGGTVHAAASADYMCIELDNGKFQFVEASGYWASYAIACAILQDTVAVGNKVWSLGVYTDTSDNVQIYNLTVSATNTKELDGGIIRGLAKGYPMMVSHDNTGSQVGAIDYISVDYISA